MKRRCNLVLVLLFVATGAGMCRIAQAAAAQDVLVVASFGAGWLFACAFSEVFP